MKLRFALKIASLLTLVVFALAIVAVVVLLYADPMNTKEQIEKLAKDEGIELDLYGDIDWAFFPTINLYVRGATASYASDDVQLDMDFQNLTISLKTLPALRGDFQFIGIEVDGAHIDIEANTEFETRSTSPKNDELEHLTQRFNQVSDLLPQAQISLLELRDITVRYVVEAANNRDEPGAAESQTFRILNLTAEDIAAAGEPFGLKAELRLSSLPETHRHLKLDSYVLMNAQNKTLSLEVVGLAFQSESTSPASQASGEGRAQLDLADNIWSLSGQFVDQETFGATTKLSGTLVPPRGDGQFELSLTDIPHWLVDQSADLPVDMLVLDTELSIDQQRLEMKDMRFRIDQGAGTGSVVYSHEGQKLLLADLALQSLDLDHYLSDDVEETRQKSNNTGLSEQAIEELRSFDSLGIKVKVAELKYADQIIKDWSLRAGFERGVGRVSIPVTSFASGTISAEFDADFSSSTDLSVKVNADSLQLGELTSDSSSESTLSGTIDFDFQGRFESITRQHLIRGLQGTGSFTFEDLLMGSMNVEQVLCESAELLGASSAEQASWASGTLLGDLRSSFSITDGLFSAKSVPFRYGNMNAVSDTRLDLFTSSIEMGMQISVDGAKTSENGCNLNKYLRGAKLPLECSGELGSGRNMDCGLDNDALKRLAVREAGDQLIDRVLDQLGSDAGDAEESADQRTSDQSDRDQVRDVLEGLLDNLTN